VVLLLTGIKKNDWTHSPAIHRLSCWRAVACVAVGEGVLVCHEIRSVTQSMMKLAGILFLLAGWGIVLSALDLLRSATLLIAFVLAGIVVEFIGLFFLFLSHLQQNEETR
jgi:predicted membrane channel-forming protein YqfA (hemolysin III family)